MNEANWRIAVDRKACMGTGECVFAAPAHFALDGGLTRPVAELTERDEAVIEAAESCPVEAITVHDGAGTLLAPGSIAAVTRTSR